MPISQNFLSFDLEITSKIPRPPAYEDSSGLINSKLYEDSKIVTFEQKHKGIGIKGAGGLHQDLPEIDFLVVSKRGE